MQAITLENQQRWWKPTLPKAFLWPTSCRKRAQVCCDSRHQDLPSSWAGLVPDSASKELTPRSLSQDSEIAKWGLLPQCQRPGKHFCTRSDLLAMKHKSNEECVGEILLFGSAKPSFTPLLCGYTRGKQDQVAREIENLVKCPLVKEKSAGLCFSRDDQELSCFTFLKPKWISPSIYIWTDISHDMLKNRAAHLNTLLTECLSEQ